MPPLTAEAAPPIAPGKPEWGPSRYVSPREIAFHVRRSPAWVYREISEGRLRACRVSGVLRVERDVFEAWLRSVTERPR